MLSITSRASLTPDELKRLHAWAVAHCVPGNRCNECGAVFADPLPCDRFVKVQVSEDMFLLYVACDACNKRYEMNSNRGFPNCYADALGVIDRIVVMPAVSPVVN